MPSGVSFHNRILSSLSDRHPFLADLKPIAFDTRHMVYHEGGPIRFVYFVETGVASVLMTMENGSTIEVGMIGCEGMIGIPALLGARTSVHQVIIQIPGHALQMEIEQCKTAFHELADFRNLIHEFIGSFMNQSAQTCACNRLHSVEQRCARWLLMSSDRIKSNDVPMTHEFLSAMLGVRRTGVTEVARELQQSGIIEYRRGQIRIIDRETLEATACECYQNDHQRFVNGGFVRDRTVRDRTDN